MASKSEKKFLDRLAKEYEKKERRVSNQLSMFYDDRILESITTSPDSDPFKKVLLTVRKESTPNYWTEEEMLKKCREIRENVKQHKSDNIEINLVNGIQRFNGYVRSLDTTLIKVIAMDAEEPVYLYIKKGDVANSLIFIGGDDCQAFLVTKNEDGVDCVIRLSEFHLLSISENSTTKEEVGLLTSYSWMGASIFSEIIFGYNLDPVKSLLLSDWFRNKRSESQESKKIMEASEDHD